MRRCRSVAWVAAALIAAGCGSTVPLNSRGESAGTAQGSSTDSGSTSTAGSGVTSGGPGSAGGGTAGSSGGSSAVGGGSPSGGLSPGSAGSSQGRSAVGVSAGVTATQIRVGIPYPVNGDAVNSAVGAAGVSTGDVKKNYEVVINDLNKRGGVLGRKVVPVWHAIDATSAETSAQKEQETCSDFTEDHKVAAVLGGGEIMMACTAKIGAVVLGGTGYQETFYAKHPNYVEFALNYDRLARLEVPALAAQKYFGAAPKVGVLTYDTPDFDGPLRRSFLPALKKYGYANPTVVQIAHAHSNADLGPVSAQISNAVLKFRTAGIDHVLIFEDNGFIAFEFLNAADKQGYYPRYGVSSANGIQALLDSGTIPAEQIVGAVGVGWTPILDVPFSQNTDTGPNANAAWRRCMKLYAAAGESYGDPNSKSIALGTCDLLNLFADVMNLGGQPNLTGFKNGLARIGASFRPASLMSARFSLTRRDGVDTARWLSYRADCKCMMYAGPPYRIP